MKRIEFSPAITRMMSPWLLILPAVLLLSLYGLVVEPRLRAARAARAQESVLRDRLAALQSAAQPGPGLSPAESAVQEFDLRTPEDDRLSDVLDALAHLAFAPAVGKVQALAIEAGDRGNNEDGADGALPDRLALDPRFALFRSPVAYAPVTVSFDASYAQLGRFFWNLRTLPTTWDLLSLEVAQATEPSLLHVKVVLAALRRVGGANQAGTPAPEIARIAAPPTVDLAVAPQWLRDPFRAAPQPLAGLGMAAPEPDPAVQAILYSSQRSMAFVDGHIVKVGDRVGSLWVTAIEPNAVVFRTTAGARKRIALKPPAVLGTIR